MKAFQGDGRDAEILSVHFIESLKNVILVMEASDIFSQVSKRSGQVNLDLFHWTWLT